MEQRVTAIENMCKYWYYVLDDYTAKVAAKILWKINILRLNLDEQFLCKLINDKK